MHLLARIGRGEPVEAESYLDIAVSEWMPRRFDEPSYERALESLAVLFKDRHGDRWLADALAAGRGDRLSRGIAALAEAAKANQADESEKALRMSGDAVIQLKAAGDAAGALRAEAEQVYALHRTFRPAECVAQADRVEREAAARQYRWIRGQVLLERGICRGYLTDWGSADRDMLRSRRLVREAGYKILELRADGIVAGTRTLSGNLLISWVESLDALGRFWSGSYPGIRAHQVYFNLGLAAEAVGLPNAAHVFVRAGVSAIAETPHRLLEGMGRARLARLAEATGRSREAAAEYERASGLFARLEPTKTVREHRLYADLDRVEAELAAISPETTLERLNVLHGQALETQSLLVQLKLHQAYGEARRRAGRASEAETSYRAAIELIEQRRDSLGGFDERSAAAQAGGKSYRGLAEIHWSHGQDPKRALDVWEWFRAGGWTGLRRDRALEERLAGLRQETFVSYASLPGGMVVWVFDDGGVEGRRLAARPAAVEAVAQQFGRLCADPDSDQATLQRLAKQLYDWLIAPIAHRLEAGRTLVVEPDGEIGGIPMQALRDENSRYLGERFAIVVASGVADYQHRARSGTVDRNSRALVVANPALDKDMVRAFPPLPQSLREGRSVAARFRNAVVLAQKDATLRALERHRPESDLFHFAGHGFSNAGNGGLLLATEGNDSLRADVLNGNRLAGQDWRRCRLAVLSACSTGTGEAKGPVNPESLVRRLLWAGAARVVASRWQIDSETSTLLMDGFYEALLKGQEVPAALKESARRLREQPATSHPYYWAGFQTFGAR